MVKRKATQDEAPSRVRRFLLDSLSKTRDCDLLGGKLGETFYGRKETEEIKVESSHAKNAR